MESKSIEGIVRPRVIEIINDFFYEANGKTFVNEEYEVKFNQYLTDNKKKIEKIVKKVVQDIEGESDGESDGESKQHSFLAANPQGESDIGEMIVDYLSYYELDDFYEWRRQAIKKDKKKLQKSILEISKKQFPFAKRTGAVVSQNIYEYANPYQDSPMKKRKSPMKKRKSPMKKRKSPMKKRKSPMKRR